MDTVHIAGIALAAGFAALYGLGKFADWIEEEKADRRARKVEAIKAELRQASMASVGALKTLRDMGPSYAQAVASMAKFSATMRSSIQASAEFEQDAMTVAALTVLSPAEANHFMRRWEAAGFSRRSMIQALKEGQDVAGLEQILSDTEASRIRGQRADAVFMDEIATYQQTNQTPDPELDLELALAPGVGYVADMGWFDGVYNVLTNGDGAKLIGEITLQDKLRALEGRKVRYRLELVEEEA